MANTSPIKRVLTQRGAATKRRIVEAAAELIHAKGAERVSLDDVMDATGASRSQLYHYFANKDDLVRKVIELQTSRILAANSGHLEPLESFEALRLWCDAIIAANRAGGVGGCPLGSLANELATHSDEARHQLDQSFAAWGLVIENGLCRMRERGQIKPGANPKAISVAVLAAIQGGILLSKTARNSLSLELALDMALSHIESFAA